MTPRCEKDGKRSRHHNWGEWGDPEPTQKTLSAFGALAAEVVRLVQFRTCAACGLQQVSEVQAP